MNDKNDLVQPEDFVTLPAFSILVLQTPRLNLRTWKDADVKHMAKISADPVVMEFFPSVQDFKATQKLVSHISKQYVEQGYTLYAVELRETQEFIGFLGLNKEEAEDLPGFIPYSLPMVEIGWRLAKEYWGRGYATEAAKAVLEYAFDELNLPEIISLTARINIRSQRIMEKIGLQYDPKSDFLHPKVPDSSQLKEHVIFRLTQEEWRKRAF